MGHVRPLLFSLAFGASSVLLAPLFTRDPAGVGGMAASAFAAALVLTWTWERVSGRWLRVLWLVGVPLLVAVGGTAWALSQRHRNDDLSTAGVIAFFLFSALVLGAAGGVFAALHRVSEPRRTRAHVAAAALLTGAAGLALAQAHSANVEEDAATRAALADWVYVDATGRGTPGRPYSVVRVALGPQPRSTAAGGGSAAAEGAVERCSARDAPELITAVESRDHARVDALLAAGADPNACVDEGDGGAISALQLALAERDEAIALRLLAAGADPDFTPGGERPLVTAVERASEAVVARMLERGARAVPASHDEPPLAVVAVHRGDAAILDRLLRAGANPHAGAGRDSALVLAERAGAHRLAELLKAAGADPEHTGPLVVAAANGDPAALQMHGYPLPALLVAIRSGHRELALAFAERVDLDLTTYGCDVVEAAADRGYADVLWALFQRPQVVPARCLKDAARSARGEAAPLLGRIAAQIP